MRYVHDGCVREDFLTFIDAHVANYDSNSISLEPILNGKILGLTVVKLLKDLGLELAHCVGIGTDGCSVMTSKQLFVKYNLLPVTQCDVHAITMH